MSTKQLNTQQKAAAYSTETPILVIAGAGTGKTTIITERINYLLNIGIFSYQILCVTFSNRAANEIKKRSKLDLQWSGTFHSICFKLLQVYSTDYTNIIIIDESDQKKISLQLGVEKYLHDINLIKDRAKVDITNELKIAYEKYQKFLKENNYMDFGQILLEMYTILTNNIELRVAIQNRFCEIIVDEYQDTSIIERDILKLLVKDGNIFCVGDPNQSIYMWRGASIENILGFQNDFKTKNKHPLIFRLEQNYRSTQQILNVANQLISYNPDNSGNNIWSHKTGTEVIICHTNNEGKYIAETIKKNNYTNIGILVRSTTLIPAISEELIKYNIKHTVQNRTKFFEKIEIKIALSYIKTIFKNDVMAFEYISNIPKRGIGEKTLEKIRSELKNKNIIEVLRMLKKNDLADLFEKYYNKYENFNNIIKPGDIMLEILECSGSLDYIKSLDRSNDRLDNIQILRDAINGFGTIDNFLTNFFILDNNEQQDNCNIMTLHSAKGLEFDVVFIPGMSEGIFPDFRAIKSSGKYLYEERRLAYVGFTRARENLYLSYNLFTPTWNRINSYGRSRFTIELPHKYIIDTTEYYRN